MVTKKGSYMKEAMGLLMATVPLLLTRLAVYAGFFFLALLWFGFWGGLGLILGGVFESGAGVLICFLIAICFGWPAWRLARKYVLYMVRAPQVAAMTEVMLGRDVPRGPGQFQYGKEIIQSYFKDVTMLWLVHEAVDAAVRALARRITRFTRWLPQNMQKLRNIVLEILRRAASYVDEAILSHAVAKRYPNAYEGAVEGLVLYAQNSRAIVLTAAKIYVVGKVMSFLLFVMFMVPALLVTAMIGRSIDGYGELLVLFGAAMAFLGARFLELALFEPFALAYMMVTFRRETEGQEPDPAWEEKLKPLHRKVGELFARRDEKAKELARRGPGMQPGEEIALPPQG
jgi:hypothetical protein